MEWICVSNVWNTLNLPAIFSHLGKESWVNLLISFYSELQSSLKSMNSRTPLIFRQPPLSAVANIFILPLQLDVWICIFILFVVVYLIMLLHLKHPILKAMSISMLDVATFILGAICQQGTHLSIITTSGRIGRPEQVLLCVRFIIIVCFVIHLVG